MFCKQNGGGQTWRCFTLLAPVMLAVFGGLACEDRVRPVQKVKSSLVDEDRPLPIKNAVPCYPKGAIIKAIEGYCTIAFTVTPIGATKDHRVKYCSNKIFETCAMEAAKALRYAPMKRNGYMIVRENVEYYYSFELDH